MPTDIATELIRQPGEELTFNYLIYPNVGAGLATSKSDMRGFISALKDLDFRVTVASEGFVNVWVNEKQYRSGLTAKAKIENKNNLRDFFKKILPALTGVMFLLFTYISFMQAVQVQVNGSFYENLGAVSFWVAFGKTFVICWVVYGVCVLLFILNGGKAQQ